MPMSWLSNSLRKHLSGEQCETYEECLARMRHGSDQAPVSPAERVALLEDDLARAVLLVHTLVEACIRKGVFTREEIIQAARQIDLFDGVADGKLDPAAVRPKEKPA